MRHFGLLPGSVRFLMCFTWQRSAFSSVSPFLSFHPFRSMMILLCFAFPMMWAQSYTLTLTSYPDVASGPANCSVAQVATTTFSFIDGTCVAASQILGVLPCVTTARSYKVRCFSGNCSNNSLNLDEYVSTDCSGPVSSGGFGGFSNGLCALLCSRSYRMSWTTAASTTPPASNVCFHENTIITYQGAAFTFAQIQQHNECNIPHIVRDVGTVITAQCGSTKKVVRLTNGHLVYTQRGLIPASSIVTSDVLFADLHEQQRCEVTEVSRELSEQNYFGLNCYKSQVLASGLKTSTFEKMHKLPSFWMSVVGRILGIKLASSFGDYIAKVANKVNLI